MKIVMECNMVGSQN